MGAHQGGKGEDAREGKKAKDTHGESEAKGVGMGNEKQNRVPVKPDEMPKSKESQAAGVRMAAWPAINPIARRRRVIPGSIRCQGEAPDGCGSGMQSVAWPR